MSWILENDVFTNTGPKIVYLHAGGPSCQAVNMKLVSQELHFAMDLSSLSDIDLEYPGLPSKGCFYFGFDRHDSRRNGIKAMITSFLCTFACRFWNDGDATLNWVAESLKKIKCWSLRDLVTMFLRVQKTGVMRGLPILLGQIDQCDEQERHVFLQAVLKRNSYNEFRTRLLITTTRPDDYICGILPPNSIINLSDYPLSLTKYLCVRSLPLLSWLTLNYRPFSGNSHLRLRKIMLICNRAHPDRPNALGERMRSLLASRPEFVQYSSKVRQILEKFRKVPRLQDTILEYLRDCKNVPAADEADDLLRQLSCDSHQRALRCVIESLSVERKPMTWLIYNLIKCAAQPLTLEFLAEAVRLSSPPEVPQLAHIHNLDVFVRDIQQDLRGIVVWDGREIKFSDDAFYEVSATGEKGEKQEHTCRSHADMATVCLRYILSESGQKMLASLSMESQDVDYLTWSPNTLPQHSLVIYALRYWTLHYRAAGGYRPVDLARELFKDDLKRHPWVEASYLLSNPFTRIQREYISPLPYMSMLGLDDLVLEQIESDTKPDGWNRYQWLAITEAARNGHSNTVALLLEHTDTDDTGLREALHWAANYGEGGGLDYLISRAQQVEGFQWPPFILDRAVTAGLENLVSALVHADYDLNEKDSTGKGRAIHTAIENGQHHVLKILLDSGRVDLGLESDAGHSLLVLAAEAGEPESIRLLLSAGASLNNCNGEAYQILLDTISWANHEALSILVNAQVHSNNDVVNASWSKENDVFPLSQAAGLGFKECTRILLDKGANPCAVGQGGCALYQAIRHGPYSDICLMLLQKGADPNQYDADDQAIESKKSILTTAIEFGDAPLVAMLLDYDAKINVRDRSWFGSPLAEAIHEERFSSDSRGVVELLLERGADPNLENKYASGDYGTSGSPLYYALKWAKNQHVAEILIAKGADIHWSRNDDGVSILHAACGLHEMLSILLAKGVDINVTDHSNWTTLMTAAARTDATQSIEVLLQNASPKADLEIVSTDSSGSTALHLACERCAGEAVKLLLEAGADINRQRGDGKFPLGLILASDLPHTLYERTVELMLERRPNMGLSDNEGNTALHNIQCKTPLSVVLRLVEEGAPVSTVNNKGYNCLAWAVRCGNTEAARYLATVKGVRTDIYHPNFGSILHLAAARSTLHFVKQLVRTGADYGMVDPKFGESLLYSAVGNEDPQECREITRYFVEELGIDVNALGGKLSTPLLRAVAEDKETSLVRYLLRHGARGDAVDNLGRMAVHWASNRGNIQNLKTLVKAGLDLSVSDKYGRRPLHFAAASGSEEVLQYVLEQLSAGINAFDVDVADVDGWTPLMWACRQTDDKMAYVLVNKYKVDIYARSKDSEWSALKITRLYFFSDEPTVRLFPTIDDRGHEEGFRPEDNEMERGECHDEICVSCEQV